MIKNNNFYIPKLKVLMLIIGETTRCAINLVTCISLKRSSRSAIWYTFVQITFVQKCTFPSFWYNIFCVTEIHQNSNLQKVGNFSKNCQKVYQIITFLRVFCYNSNSRCNCIDDTRTYKNVQIWYTFVLKIFAQSGYKTWKFPVAQKCINFAGRLYNVSSVILW